MNLEENKEWQELVKNNDIGIGKVIVTVAKEAMCLLSHDNTPLHNGIGEEIDIVDKHTPFGLIYFASYLMGEKDVDGFMVKQIAKLIVEFHKRGKEFRTIWNEDSKI